MKFATKQMMKNSQLANAECPDKKTLRDFTWADSIKKLAAKVEIDDDVWEGAGL